MTENKRISIRTGQTLSNPSHSSLRDGFDSSWFSVIHKSELSSNHISGIFVTKKSNFEFNNQDASTTLIILGLYELTRMSNVKHKTYEVNV